MAVICPYSCSGKWKCYESFKPAVASKIDAGLLRYDTLIATVNGSLSGIMGVCLSDIVKITYKIPGSIMKSEEKIIRNGEN